MPLGRNITIAPSILSADFSRLGDAISKVENAGATALHIDVMDGHFVPNITVGPPIVASIRAVTDLPLDVHLMIDEPARYVDPIRQAGADWISVHAEADAHLHRTIQHIRNQGARGGVALNPATPLCDVEEILPYVDYVLLMTVNPGFGGQEFIPESIDKIQRMREMIVTRKLAVQIEVDGGIGASNLNDVLDAGADIIVSGSAVYRHPSGPGEGVRELTQIAKSFSRIFETT